MGLFGGPDGEKVLAKGTPEAGVVTGVRFTYASDSETLMPIQHYAIALASGRTIGVRQKLVPYEPVRLGMQVAVRTLDDATVIDWAATLAATGQPGSTELFKWKSMKEPPAPGIVDEIPQLTAARKQHTHANLRITAVTPRSAAFGLSTAIDFEVVVSITGSEPYALELRNVAVPCYAGHLPVAGQSLPCWVNERRLDRVVIDWPAAAMADPGVGRPTVQLIPAAPPVQAMAAGPAVGVREQVDAVDQGIRIGGITMSTLVKVEAGLVRDRIAPANHDAYAQQYGVAPGTWSAAAAAWQQHMRTDWRVGAAYGEAFEAATKRRR
jgi:hypothetical protein